MNIVPTAARRNPCWLIPFAFGYRAWGRVAARDCAQTAEDWSVVKY